jgi:hypothetical protein
MAARLEYTNGEFGNAKFPCKVILIKGHIRLTIDLAFYRRNCFVKSISANLKHSVYEPAVASSATTPYDTTHSLDALRCFVLYANSAIDSTVEFEVQYHHSSRHDEHTCKSTISPNEFLCSNSSKL